MQTYDRADGSKVTVKNEGGVVTLLLNDEVVVECKDQPLELQKKFTPRFRELVKNEPAPEKPKRTSRKKKGDK